MVFNLLSSFNFLTVSYLGYLWNLGFCLFIFLFVMIVSGMVLACYYTPTMEGAFSSLSYLTNEVKYGWLISHVHCVGASFFFFLLYLHMYKSMFFGLSCNSFVWFSGFFMYLFCMFEAFLGYCLPMGSMSYWAMVVVVNFFSVFPFFEAMKSLILGGSFICDFTLKSFFVLHFILPFVVLFVSFMHVLFLHMGGSSSGGFEHFKVNKFFPYLFFKDFFVLCLILIGFIVCVCFFPFDFYNYVNFVEYSPSSTPEHISPEWYLVPFFLMLKSFSSKSFGLFFLFLCFFFLFCSGFSTNMPYSFYFSFSSFFFSVLFVFVFLVFVFYLDGNSENGALMKYFSFLFLLCCGNFSVLFESGLVFDLFCSFLLTFKFVCLISGYIYVVVFYLICSLEQSKKYSFIYYFFYYCYVKLWGLFMFLGKSLFVFVCILVFHGVSVMITLFYGVVFLMVGYFCVAWLFSSIIVYSVGYVFLHTLEAAVDFLCDTSVFLIDEFKFVLGKNMLFKDKFVLFFKDLSWFFYKFFIKYGGSCNSFLDFVEDVISDGRSDVGIFLIDAEVKYGKYVSKEISSFSDFYSYLKYVIITLFWSLFSAYKKICGVIAEMSEAIEVKSDQGYDFLAEIISTISQYSEYAYIVEIKECLFELSSCFSSSLSFLNIGFLLLSFLGVLVSFWSFFCLMHVFNFDLLVGCHIHSLLFCLGVTHSLHVLVFIMASLVVFNKEISFYGKVFDDSLCWLFSENCWLLVFLLFVVVLNFISGVPLVLLS